MGRSHVAKALVARGHAETVPDAFTRLIGRGRPCYIAKDAATAHEVISTIRRLGAVPVLAHPGITRVDDLLGEMVASGLLGIEAYHADHSAEQRARYATLAADLGLIATGGTDYHGPEALNPEIGAVDVPNDQVRRLIALGPKATRD
jgi:3',5'-nucleoside bisphosphate phosphatase